MGSGFHRPSRPSCATCVADTNPNRGGRANMAIQFPDRHDSPDSFLVFQHRLRGGYTHMLRMQMLMVAVLLLAALIVLAPGAFSFAQTAPPAILAVDLENFVSYQQDFGDATKFATDPNVPALPAIRNFQPFVFIADVVAVNGKPVKGTFTARGTNITRSTTLSLGNAIADAAGGPYYDSMIGINAVDGTQIGTIMATGWGGSAKAPGSPSSVVQGNFTVTGGTGAFLGVRGQLGARGMTL